MDLCFQHEYSAGGEGAVRHICQQIAVDLRRKQ